MSNLLHVRLILFISKLFIILCLLCLCKNREYPGNFQNKSVNSPFNSASRYILFLPKLQEEERPFLEGCKKGHYISRLSQRALKVSPFVKFEIILPLRCILLYPLTNKHYKTWSSMINLMIDSRTRQKKKMLLSPRPKFNNNYLELSKENVLRNMKLSH